MNDVPVGVTAAAWPVVCADSLGRALLEVAARAIRHQPVDDLTWMPLLGRHGRIPHPERNTAVALDAQLEALPPEALDHVDPDQVAEWIVGHYPEKHYPAVVFGSPHGASVHLAAALEAPWLPTGFTLSVRWPGGRAGDWRSAAAHGTEVAARLLAAHPEVVVRQVHDPIGFGPRAASTVTFEVQWRTLPAAYRRFIAGRPTLLLRDVRPWPVARLAERHSFQVGRPTHGWGFARYDLGEPAFARALARLGEDRWERPFWARSVGPADTAVRPEFEADLQRAGRRAMHLLYTRADALSAAVADLYRTWLRGRDDDCVVECDRLLDPWRVLVTGRTPYWCESASGPAVAAAELWLAGSRPFGAVTVMPQPPGTRCGPHADLARWRSVARFGRSRGDVNRQAATRYPELPLATGHAAAIGAPVRAVPAPMPAEIAVRAFRRASAVDGLMIV